MTPYKTLNNNSDDLGKNWSDIVLAISSDKEKMIQAQDIQLWINPEGKLFVFWQQKSVEILTGETDRFNCDGYIFDDPIHAQWLTICDDPDAEKPVFSPGRYWDKGFLRCKPTVMSNGECLFWNYDQVNDQYGYSISKDQGVTVTHYYGPNKVLSEHDEPMSYEMGEGVIRMFARCLLGEIAEAVSTDYGRTWGETTLSGIIAPNSRFYVSRTPSGRILLVNNDHAEKRCRMTVQLSEDDGRTWNYKHCVDDRDSLSYPDVDFHDDRIYLVYDRERAGEGAACEILLTSFTEEELMKEECQFELTVISKPGRK